MIKCFAHVCLAAADLAATEHFYCGGLGLTKAFDFIRDGRVIGFYLELCPGEFVEVFQRAESAVPATGPILHFCLEVDDLEPVGRRLTGHGYEVTPKTLGADHSWQMWTTDPNGVKIEFHQYTPRSCQLTHEPCSLS